MTRSEERPATLASTFDFARRQRDPGFRRYLHDIGVTSQHDIVIAFDDEPVVSVVARIIHNHTSSPCLIAIPHPDEPYGFRMMFAEAGAARTHWPAKRPDPVQLGKDASIGMLYSALASSGEFVPGEWVRPVVFKQVPAQA
ncbi:hypothetical protein RB614_02130 [Phytohabitans sp. ZYX-F-186]|uniref:Uncharacterized protein n=1 Tax=Phytohabitans maris TaxID=3071409 RepID=A0ABU0Z8D2_9ACTN|nr:hypothetical protein [Phytohabitans sp. ZYX-F-186]MDQ7903318.1 hypothetical protein [Phytohabitans sp. ZYX-F-186]